MSRAQIVRLLLFAFILLMPVFLLTSSFSGLFLNGFLVTIGALTLLWLVSLAITDASIIDIYWGCGFVIIAWFYAYSIGFEEIGTRGQVLLGMISLWGLRLGAYLAKRNLGKGEDFRYAQWRQDNGQKWWWLSFFRVFLLQGALLWIISSLYVPAFSIGGELSWLEYIGIVLWAIGFYFEAIGDAQMMAFKANPDNKGKVMNTGLWRYTRHPNYFGDALLWWGFFCFCLAHPDGIKYIYAPALMSLLLVKVSGVAMLERTLKKTKPKYAEYIRRTSAFIPMPPKD